MMQNSNEGIFGVKFLKDAISKSEIKAFVAANRERLLAPIKKWAQMLADGVIKDEESFQDPFINTIFAETLGYTRQGDGTPWTCTREYKNQGKSADAVLGFFWKGAHEDETTFVAIELKSPSTKDLARRPPQKEMSAVEQAHDYASKIGPCCRWVVVSNMDEIRLYHAGDQKRYEVFSIPSLANNLPEFEKFYFLLTSQNLIPTSSDKKESILDALYAKNRADEKEINAKFYASYSGIRDRLFSDLSKSNPGFDKLLLLEKIQKILDRFIFLCFCEDKNFIGESTLGEQITKFILNAPKKVFDGSIWHQFIQISKALIKGADSPIKIPPYNGGLFEDDPELESLKVPNEALEYLNEIASYDFASTLDVNILGHIFEQSVSDIEEIKANIRNEEFDKTKGKRKRQGIYYTPSYITGFIIEKTVGAWIEREKEALGFPNLPIISEEEEKQLSDVEANPKTKLPKNLADKASLHAKAWLALQEKLKTIKILDPACGSGAFLNKAFEYLVDRHEEILSQRRHFGDKAGGIELEGGQRFDDFVAKNNLYGVDLSKESVEITKLSLWLRLVYHMEKLPALNHAIKYGDSIVDDPAYTKAPFCWDKEFPFKFDVVLGNPPYVRQEFLSPIKPALQKIYPDTFNGVADLYTYFYRRGFQLLKDDGFLGFITSSTFTKTSSGEPLREFLKNSVTILEFVDFGDLQVFQDATTYPCIFIAKNETPQPPLKEGGLDGGSFSPPFSKGGRGVQSFTPINSHYCLKRSKELDMFYDGTHLPFKLKLQEKANELRKNMTKAEKKLWHEFLRDFEPKALRQHPIDTYIVDFYISKLKLVIEIDGDSHYTEDGVAGDKTRSEILENYGLRVLRFTNDEVLSNFEGVCQRIDEYKNETPQPPLKEGGLCSGVSSDPLKKGGLSSGVSSDPLKKGGLGSGNFSPPLLKGDGSECTSSSPFSKGGRGVQSFDPKAQNTITFMRVNKKPDTETDWKAMYANSDIFTMPQASLDKDSWNFDKPEIEALRKKIFGKGRPLKDVVGSPLYGIKTGLNEAFIIDKATKDRLIKEEWELRQKKMQTPQPPLKEGGLGDDGFSPPLLKGGRGVVSSDPVKEGELVDGSFSPPFSKNNVSDCISSPPFSEGDTGNNFTPPLLKGGRGVQAFTSEDKGVQSFDPQTPTTSTPNDNLSPTSHPLIKPFLVGKDLKQWHYEDNGRYLIAIQKGHTREWAGNPKLTDEKEAWETYSSRYPAIANFHRQFEDKAKKRQDQGDFWWELRACDYYKAFEEPKIVWPDLSRTPKYCLENNGSFIGNTAYMCPAHFWLLSILTSRVLWFEIQQTANAMRGGMWRYRLIYQTMEVLIIVEPPGSEDDPSTPKGKLASLARLCQDSAFERHRIRKDFLEIVGDEVRQNRPADDRKKASPEDDDVSEGSAINKWDTLGWDEIVKAAQSPSAFGKPFKDYTKNPLNTLKLKKVYQQLAPQCHELTARIHEAEREINQIVYGLYDLTPDEIRLLEEQTGNIYED